MLLPSVSDVQCSNQYNCSSISTKVLKCYKRKFQCSVPEFFTASLLLPLEVAMMEAFAIKQIYLCGIVPKKQIRNLYDLFN